MATTREHRRDTIIHVVLDEQDGFALRVQLHDTFYNNLQERRIDASRRFIEQDHVRIGHQHTGQFQQLPLTAGQNPRRLVFEV